MRYSSLIIGIVALIVVSCSGANPNEPEAMPETLAQLRDVEIMASTMDDFDNPRYYSTTLSIKNGTVSFSWYEQGNWDKKQERTRRLTEAEAQRLVQTLNVRAFTAVRAYPRCGNQMESVGLTYNGNTYWIGFEVGSSLHSIQYQVEGDITPDRKSVV